MPRPPRLLAQREVDRARLHRGDAPAIQASPRHSSVRPHPFGRSGLMPPEPEALPESCSCRVLVLGVRSRRGHCQSEMTPLAAVAVILLSAATAVASTRIRAYENPAVIQGLEIRPPTLTMAADGNDTITGLRWNGWGSSTARASGINHVNNCLPDCASGHITKMRVTVRLFTRGFTTASTSTGAIRSSPQPRRICAGSACHS